MNYDRRFIWVGQFFGLEVGENGGVKDPNTPVCRIGSCQARVKTKHSSTSNLYSHLKQHHPNEYELVRPNKIHPTKTKASGSGTITDAFKPPTKFPLHLREHIALTKSVTYHLAKDMRPLSTVELPGFQRMVARLNPCYQLPSRSYFSRTAIPVLYCQVREDIEKSC